MGRRLTRLRLAAMVGCLIAFAALVAIGSARQVTGTHDRDELAGTRGADTIYGDSGADKIRGRAGADRIFSDPTRLAFDPERGIGSLRPGGDDRVRGDSGDDKAETGSGKDFFDGGSGDDVARLGPGDDTFAGGPGDDTALGGSGRDTLVGGDGDDALLADDGGGSLEGGRGDDVLSGGFGADQEGGDGEDVLSYCTDVDCFGTPGAPATLDGGGGDDSFQVRPLGNVRVELGGGDDVVAVDLDGLPKGATLAGLDIDGDGGGRDTLVVSGDDAEAEVPADLENEFEEVEGEEADEGEASRRHARAAQNTKSTIPSGLFRVTKTETDEPQDAVAWRGHAPLKIAIAPAERPNFAAVTIFVERDIVARAEIKQVDSQPERFVSKVSNGAVVCNDGKVLSEVDIDLSKKSFTLACLPKGGGGIHYIFGQFEASSGLEEAQALYKKLEGTSVDLTGKSFALDVLYPASFTSLSDASGHFSSLRPVWTLTGLRDLIDAAGAAKAEDLVRRSGFSILNTLEPQPPPAQDPFQARVVSLGDLPFSTRNDLVAFAEKNAGNNKEAFLRSLSAVEVSRSSATSPRLFTALKNGERMLSASFDIPTKGSLQPTTGTCGGKPCNLYGGSTSGIKVSTKLEVWTPERGGSPSGEFTRFGQVAGNGATPIQMAGLAPQMIWRKPIWNMRELEKYYDSARNPQAACAAAFPPPNTKTAPECVQSLTGGDGGPPADFFYEFLEGLWVNGVSSGDLALPNDQGTRTEFALNDVNIAAGEAHVTSADAGARYHYLEFPMLIFRPFGIFKKQTQGQYRSTGWPYQSYCVREEGCRGTQWKHPDKSDIAEGYNSTLLKLRKKNGPDRIALRLTYAGHPLGEKPNPCNTAPTGFGPEDDDRGQVTRPLVKLRYSASNKQRPWEAVSYEKLSRASDKLRAAVGELGLGTTKKLEYNTIRVDGERALVCVTFAYETRPMKHESDFGRSDAKLRNRTASEAEGAGGWYAHVGQWSGRLRCPTQYPVNASAWKDKFGDKKGKVNDFGLIAGTPKKFIDAGVAVSKVAGDAEKLLKAFSATGSLEKLQKVLGYTGLAGLGTKFALDLVTGAYDWLKDPPRQKVEPYDVAINEALPGQKARWSADGKELELDVKGKGRGIFKELTFRFGAEPVEGDQVGDSARWGDAELGLKHEIGGGSEPGYQDISLYSQNEGEVSAWIQCTNRDQDGLADNVAAK